MKRYIALILCAAVLLLAGCASVKIKRTYGTENIQTETISSWGFLNRRAGLIDVTKTQDADGATQDFARTQYDEDPAPAIEAMVEFNKTLGLIASMYSGYMSGGASSIALPAVSAGAACPAGNK
ncbi:MAG TPA: hypothetical protein PLL36_13715 [Candidatus Hydrogenedentes bacterium]|nr:hypothetical protein [Candidatus Hydrogenedentota bacterium]